MSEIRLPWRGLDWGTLALSLFNFVCFMMLPAAAFQSASDVDPQRFSTWFSTPKWSFLVAACVYLVILYFVRDYCLQLKTVEGSGPRAGFALVILVGVAITGGCALPRLMGAFMAHHGESAWFTALSVMVLLTFVSAGAAVALLRSALIRADRR